jgi:hypothetical protein
MTDAAMENFRVFFRLFILKSLQTKKLKRILQTFLQKFLQTYYIYALIMLVSPKEPGCELETCLLF